MQPQNLQMHGTNSFNSQGANPTIVTNPEATIWMGAIQPTWDESFLYRLFANTGDLVRVKLIRNQTTGLPAGYAFIYFRTHEAARQVLEMYNGRNIPGTNLVFRLNWGARGKGTPTGSAAQPQLSPHLASQPHQATMQQPLQHSALQQQQQGNANQHSLFIGDLSPEVTDQVLLQTFKMRYNSCVDAKVIIDPSTGQSKGYGFVRFVDKQESLKAMNEMQGAFIGTRQIRIGEATQRKSDQSPTAASNPAMAAFHQGGVYNFVHTMPPPQQQPPPIVTEQNASTVFIGNLDPSIDQVAIRAHFSSCGEIENIKIPPNRGCGFVKFATRAEAEQAIKTLHGSMLGNTRIRLDWGKFNAGRSLSVPNSPTMAHPTNLQAMSPVGGTVGVQMMYATPAAWAQMPYYAQAAAPPAAYYGQYFPVQHTPQQSGVRGFVDPANVMGFPPHPYAVQGQFSPRNEEHPEVSKTNQQPSSPVGFEKENDATNGNPVTPTVAPTVAKVTDQEVPQQPEEEERQDIGDDTDYTKPFDVKASNKSYVAKKKDLDSNMFQSRVANNMTMIS